MFNVTKKWLKSIMQCFVSSSDENFLNVRNWKKVQVLICWTIIFLKSNLSLDQTCTCLAVKTKDVFFQTEKKIGWWTPTVLKKGGYHKCFHGVQWKCYLPDMHGKKILFNNISLSANTATERINKWSGDIYEQLENKAPNLLRTLWRLMKAQTGPTVHS